MQTTEKAYHEFLESRYLPGRELYLRYVVYPKYLALLLKDDLKITNTSKFAVICDLGCGTGSFLAYCKKRGIRALGIDSNQHLIERCISRGLKALHDDITKFESVDSPIDFALCDNVLEHLNEEQLISFFKNLGGKMSPCGILLVVVPGRSGFMRDPTHRTFITTDNISNYCEGFTVTDKLYHPVNAKAVGGFFYLNMTILKLRRH
ncbi:MAG: class I SAM-dependent methyltransferase [Bdellovibrionota bacterium]